MLATVFSATLSGLEGRVVRVEVDVAPGLPGFTIVGLPDAALQEARERVRGAIRNSGFEYPPRRITVNLAPADVPKQGASLDLPIAIGVLLGSEQVHATGRWALLGELSLGGELRAAPGTLPMVAALAAAGIRRVVLPAAALGEAALVRGAESVPARTLRAAADAIRGRRVRGRIAPRSVDLAPFAPVEAGAEGSVADARGPSVVVPDLPDLADVRGQLEARRALEIALAGGHGLLLWGPPGSGKTLLARTIPTLMPPLDDDEALAATIVASVAGAAPAGLVRRRPFRAPHHTTSYAGMVGGGPRLAPGEVTLADAGVLFLDELPEFGRDVLEALRQPLEEGSVTVVRVGRSATFPARFQLVAAMNPCPCGWHGSDRPRCICPEPVPRRYVARISGPLRDRIDLWVMMPRVAAGEVVGAARSEPSAVVAARIAHARQRQAGRQGRLNGRLRGDALRGVCRLDPAAVDRAVTLSEMDAQTARGTERLLRVARTIADLAGSLNVELAHLDEAARFRSPASRFDRAIAV
ncbi:MAG TPA: YifB family Mg chelatase-like AAA ATPase [Candidatus Limnocylindrales bacterium]